MQNGTFMNHLFPTAFSHQWRTSSGPHTRHFWFFPDLHKPQPPSHHVLSITQPWEDSVPLLLTELFQKLPSWLPCPQSTLCYWNTSDSSWPLPGPNPRPFKISSKVSPALPSDTIILQTVSNDSPLTTYLLYTTVNEVNVACSPSEIIVLPLSTC